ncbi:uncharacterized protein LOC143469148 [Clavelina lepadiformis]|uniref:uncharacterized protein LOC143469148 n=1 Tax=Clavelina lepadiformis TaxID=159417 RepID=UPI0040431856
MFSSKTCFRLILLLLICCVIISLCAGISGHKHKRRARQIRRRCNSRYRKVLRAILRNNEKCLKVFSQSGAKLFRKKCPRKAKLVLYQCKLLWIKRSNYQALGDEMVAWWNVSRGILKLNAS